MRRLKQRPKLLKDCQVGDRIRLTVTGGIWTVIHRTKEHPNFNAVIQLQYPTGNTRTYSNRMPRWKQRVWPVPPWEK